MDHDEWKKKKDFFNSRKKGMVNQPLQTRNLLLVLLPPHLLLQLPPHPNYLWQNFFRKH
jgi:hypothetical protein